MILSSLRAAILGIAGAALLTGAVACSSEAAAAPDHAAFEQCLSDNGVPAPPAGGPGGPGGPPPSGPIPSGAPADGAAPPPPPGVDQNTWDTAMQACRALAPAPPNR
ncbi:hypothetical protein L2K20_11290 [Mycobacterium sp. MBM]|nr:hypothetical protein [Mycobacterium sp. MBM]